MIKALGGELSTRHAVRNRLILLFLLSAAAIGPIAAAANPCKATNLMPSYFDFFARTSGMAAPRRAQAFITDIALKHPEFYVPEDYDDRAKMLATATKFFSSNENESTIAADNQRQTADALVHAISTVAEQYVSTFPDFSCNATISIGPSLGRFDAYGFTDSRGRDFVRFGVDKLSRDRERAQIANVVAPIFFQIYFSQLYPDVSADDFDGTWQAMWVAGVGAYIGEQFNKGIGDDQALSLPSASVDEMKHAGMMEKAARALLAAFGKRDSETYMKWFSASRSPDGFPKGVGAYMGLRFAKELGRTHTLDQLVHIPPAEEKRLILLFLQRQAQAA